MNPGFFARPHQNEAIEKTRPVLDHYGRATIEMCCASGKTLIEIRLAAPYDHVLILEPSLALISQTLSVARRDALCRDRSILCICSDPTVTADDEWQVSEEELGIPVTTSLAEIRSALQSLGRQRSLVFCTLNSQHLLSDAMPEGFRFGLTIVDEAHRTVGQRDRKFSLALEDRYIPSKHRVFATATRRFIAPDVGVEGELEQNGYSMDDTSLYGPVSYRLSFPDAIARGIVSDYQLLVSCVTDRDVMGAITDRSRLLLPNSKATVELVAGQLSVIKAIEHSHTRRIITFHRSINDAKKFATDPAGLFERAGIQRFHINGRMSAAQKQRLLAEFLNCPRPAIMTNARCLTEGVDIPAVDMIAIMSRRESTTDLAQAIGRALRLHPTKARGYIMVPLYMDADANLPEVALKRSDFGAMWDVLFSLLGNDDRLAERLWYPTHHATDGTRPAHSTKAQLQILASADLEQALQHSISVRAVDRLVGKWDQMYAAARAFREREGHLLTPSDHIEDDLPLGPWVVHQRLLHQRSRLSADRIGRLDEIGMAWTEGQARWTKHFLTLLQFVERNKHFCLPAEPAFQDLRSWITMVRNENTKDKLSTARAALLNSIDFPWTETEATWQRYIGQLREFRRLHPEPNAAIGKLNLNLLDYIQNCRKAYRRGQLSEEKAEELRALAISIDAKPKAAYRRARDSWMKHYSALQRYAQRNGSVTSISKNHIEGDLRMGGWLNSQRVQRRAGKLSVERQQLLDQLKVTWDPFVAAWEARLEELRQFREKYRHQHLEAAEGTLSLMRWVQRQRADYARGLLPNHYTKKLEAINFQWTRDGQLWEYYLDQLASFRARYGQAVPLRRHKEYTPLYSYLALQRRRHGAKLLSKEQLQGLASLGIEWASQSSEDERMLASLRILMQRSGKANFPTQLAADPALSEWVQSQSARAANGSLPESIRKALKSMRLLPRSDRLQQPQTIPQREIA